MVELTLGNKILGEFDDLWHIVWSLQLFLIIPNDQIATQRHINPIPDKYPHLLDHSMKKMEIRLVDWTT